ncbi:sensor histidine kinase [Caulobacter sp. S45]|uniref:sensor histidine kinase n=1 Tax=Caulobacter sp. S45 TaxID=1641861 RepID=UPI0020B122EC|nr:ATP-binding protein [Caulobacter sp. S45]
MRLSLRRTPAIAKAAPGFGSRSLVARLIALASIWSLLLLAAIGIALTAFFHHAATSRFNYDLTVLANDLYAGAGVDAGGQITAPSLGGDFRRAYSGAYWQIADLPKGGRPIAIARSRSLWDQVLNVAPPTLAMLQAKPGQLFYYDTLGPAQDGREPLRASALLAFLPGHAAPVLFVAAQNRAALDRDVRRFGWATAAAMAILGVGLVGVVFIQVRVGLNPLFAMGREIAEVRKGRAQRLTRPYPSELAPLANELNALLDHNQEVVERQRTHVGNLAHALKTPISVLLTEAVRTPGPLSEMVTRQAETMRHQVEHHLRRARAAARSQGSGERTPVAEVLDEIVRTLERIFRAREVMIDWEAGEDLLFLGERQDLQELAGNVLENACKFCRSRVRAEAEPLSATRWRLTVEDDGPGLPPDQRLAMLKRGERLDENAPGSGLGLSIVDELARAYGGSLTLSESRFGGLRVDLELPRAET